MSKGKMSCEARIRELEEVNKILRERIESIEKDTKKEVNAAYTIKSIFDMTENEIRKLEFRRESYIKETIIASSVVVYSESEEDLHDSGYRRMTALCLHPRTLDPFIKTTWKEKHDVIRLRSISKDLQITMCDWRMDCLAKSGFMHIWFPDRFIEVDMNYSNLDLFPVKAEYLRK